MSERIDEVVRRLRDEETAQNEAAKTHVAWKRLRSPLVDTNIHSNYIMSVRFNKLVALLERNFGLRGKTILSCGCGSALYEIAFANAEPRSGPMTSARGCWRSRVTTQSYIMPKSISLNPTNFI